MILDEAHVCPVTPVLLGAERSKGAATVLCATVAKAWNEGSRFPRRD